VKPSASPRVGEADRTGFTVAELSAEVPDNNMAKKRAVRGEPQGAWAKPSPFGAPSAVQSLSGTAAPLLAGFSGGNGARGRVPHFRRSNNSRIAASFRGRLRDSLDGMGLATEC
jgi:hypothetical protein